MRAMNCGKFPYSGLGQLAKRPIPRKFYALLMFALVLAVLFNVPLEILTAGKVTRTTTFTDAVRVYAGRALGIIKTPDRYLDMLPQDKILASPRFSKEGSQDLLILVSTSPENMEQREAIRETYGSMSRSSYGIPGHLDVKIIFVAGVSADDIGFDIQLQEESHEFDDVILLDVISSSTNETRKMIGALNWVNTHCPNLNAVMKVNDDVFVNVPAVLDFVQRSAHTMSIYGSLKQQPKPDSSSDYVEWWRSLPYLCGSSYLMGRAALDSIAALSLHTSQLLDEAIFVTGLLASEAKVKVVDTPGLSCEEVEEVNEHVLCSYLNGHLVSGRGFSHGELFRLWNALGNSSQPDCEKSTVPLIGHRSEL